MTDVHALFDLTGRVAVVTGGGGALGTEIALGLADAGAAVAVLDLRQENAQRVADQIAAAGGRAIAIGADLSSETGVDEAFARIDAELERVDILVNAVSAAVDRFAPEDFPLADWELMMGANLTGFFLCTRAAGKRMLAAGRGGSIINFGSIAGVTALGRGSLAYSVAKGGVTQLTRETAYAWADKGIRVNAILPCQFINDWWRGNTTDPDRAALVARVTSAIPMGRMGEPSEIVGPVLFLASDAASMVTGILLPVDGGNLAMNAGASIDW
jgi:NAD(P)-dependent dehydrogenase (short-subunit alcohol dehydrogenase family)